MNRKIVKKNSKHWLGRLSNVRIWNGIISNHVLVLMYVRSGWLAFFGIFSFLFCSFSSIAEISGNVSQAKCVEMVKVGEEENRIRFHRSMATFVAELCTMWNTRENANGNSHSFPVFFILAQVWLRTYITM